MRSYSEAVKADVRRRMGPPRRQSVARISEELGHHLPTHHRSWDLVVPLLGDRCLESQGHRMGSRQKGRTCDRSRSGQ